MSGKIVDGVYMTKREIELNEVRYTAYKAWGNYTPPNPYKNIDEGKAIAWEDGLRQAREENNLSYL